MSRYRTLLSGWLAAPAMIALGEMSYSIYVVHTWTLRTFNRNQANAVSSVWATYRLIEVPSRRRLRAIIAGRMVKAFGPHESNRLPAGHRHSLDSVVAPILAFLGILAACAAYQFLFVPLYRFSD